MEEVAIAEDGALLLVRVTGSHFIWKMVRRIVGVLVEAGRGGLSAAEVGRLLASDSDLPPRLTAPSSGLFLERVFYEPPPDEPAADGARGPRRNDVTPALRPGPRKRSARCAIDSALYGSAHVGPSPATTAGAFCGFTAKSLSNLVPFRRVRGLPFLGVVPSPSKTATRLACHWGRVKGPSRAGHTTWTMVWICEYPYRTVRLSGPNPEDCEGCRAAIENARRRATTRPSHRTRQRRAPASTTYKTIGGLKPADYDT